MQNNERETMNAKPQAPLEDVMAAMDVVDTLRHQRDIAERELDAGNRRARLLERLKTLYQGQGIEVPEHILQEGIDALEQERFEYHGVTPSWRTRLANIWVSRGRWGKPVALLGVIAAVFYAFYFATEVLPERSLRAGLPASLAKSVQRITEIAKNPSVVANANTQLVTAKQYLDDGDFASAQQINAQLAQMQTNLQRSYSIRIVSRARESSGVWRVPDVNESSRNYYLIVEAIDSAGKVVALDIYNEETSKSSLVTTWGIRVNEKTFYEVAADKQDDGIIQHNTVGKKLPGFLQEQFSIPTSGGRITQWN